MSAVSEGPDIATKTLYLNGEGVAEVSPDILGTAAVKLTRLDLVYHPTSRQIEEILTRLATTEDNKLRKFWALGGPFNISPLSPPNIVGDALLKLENLNCLLRYLVLSHDQTSHLMTKIKDTEDLGLTELDLGDLDISQVAPDVVAGAVIKLERVVIDGVTPAQLQAIFSRIQFGGCKLKNLTVKRADLYAAVTPEFLLESLRVVETSSCGRFVQIIL